MFLGGAERQMVDLRVPSFKGLMRFWWRAMNCSLPLHEMKGREAEMFGGGGEKGRRSGVTIRIKTRFTSEDIGRSLWKEIPFREKVSKRGKEYKVPEKYDGVAYLLYSVFMLNERPYLKTGLSFSIDFSSFSDDMLRQSVASFWSLAYLGGIGSRARRGGGNIVVTDVADEGNVLEETDLNFILNGRSNDEIGNWLVENYKKARAVVNEDRKTRFISEYPNLSISRFIISNTSFSTWKEALNEIGEKFMHFRTSNRGDVFGTAAFGLPRNHVSTNKEGVNRRSSPLIFKILKSKNNECYWMALRLAGEFLPKNVVLKDGGRSQRPTYEKVDEFWNELKKHGKEHILSVPDTLDKVKEKIRKELLPKKIILFGSKARGDFHEKSDIDIAVDTDKTIAFLDVNGAIDIVKLGKVNKSFREKIKREGIEL